MDIVKITENFVTGIYNEKINPRYSFHNLKHVERTVEAAKLIAAKSGVSESDIEILTIAAWFHDIGHLDVYEGHEDVSADIAQKFLEENDYPNSKIEKIVKCIKATNLSINPQNILEKIMRDADLIHLGKKSFFKRNKELRKELKENLGREWTDTDWAKSDIKFFKGQPFYTDYVNMNFNNQREKNLQTIKENADQDNYENNKSLEKFTEEQLKGKKPDRGIETMFRLTSKNHFTLSSIADSKAGTLISISAVIISIIISVLIRKLDSNPALIIPTVFLLMTLMGTIVFAVLSTRPTITSLGLTKEDVKKRKGNLLFFGNFISMPVEDYEWSMAELMSDKEYLYNNLIRDIYYLGIVLDKKYRYLRYAYNIFMYGLVVSVFTYIIAFAF